MASRYRADLTRLTVTIILWAATVAMASAEQPDVVLGAGVTGRVHVLHDDIVLESTGLVETVRDYADWDAPEWVGWNLHENSLLWSEVVSDGDLLVAMNADPGSPPVGFAVYDFADAAAPVEVGMGGGLMVDSGWLRGRAFYAATGNVIIVYDLSAPATPSFSGIVMTGRPVPARHFSAVGGTLYLVDAEDGLSTTLRAVDVTVPLHPVDLGPCLNVTGRVDDMVAGDGVLYALVSHPGMGAEDAVDLVTWSTATRSQPVEVDRLNLCTGVAAAGRALTRDGTLLLAATSDGRLRSFGLATPAAPATGWVLDHDVRSLALGAHAMFVEAADGLFTYGRVSHDRTPGTPYFRTPLPRLDVVAGDGPVQIAQVHGDDTHLWPLDVANPRLPRIEKPIDVGLRGRLQYADGLGLIRQTGNPIRLLDLSDPRQPRLCAEVPPWGPSPGALVLGGAVLAVMNTDPDQPSAFRLYDVRDPDAPVLRSVVADRDPLYGDGRWLVCGVGLGGADRPRLWKLDDDLQAVLYGVLRTRIGIVTPVRVVGDCVYLFGQDADYVTLMEIHDISGVPRLVRTVTPGMIVRHVAQFGDELIVAGNSWCQIYDVSTPADPREKARFYLGGEAVGLARNGNVATIGSRLVTVSMAPGASAAVPPAAAAPPARLLPAQPNPFNPRTTIAFVLERDLELVASVYDVRGHHLRDLAAGRFDAGPHSVDWDGRAADGRALASGTYFVRLHGPGVEAVQSVTLVK